MAPKIVDLQNWRHQRERKQLGECMAALRGVRKLIAEMKKQRKPAA